jgi:hypothetical protein
MAQLPEDVIRMTWFAPSGTARSQAIGGAIGSLGGEITSTFVNPAGLGFYKVSEFVLTPGFTLGHSDASYRDASARSNNVNRFNMSTTGFVSATSDPGRQWVSKAFSIAVNRTANYNNSIYYKGTNDYSSYSEQFAEELSGSRVNINNYQNSNLSLGTKSAIHTYLIDTVTLNGQVQVVGRPEYLNAVLQQNRVDTKGGITEIALGYAGNLQDKFYIGGSIGLPIVNYERRTVFTESDATDDKTNKFGFSRYEETLKTTGLGFNAKLGVIFKPASQLRLGAAIHTPTIYGLKDALSTKMVTDVENLFNNDPIDSVSSNYFGPNPVYKYDFASPWKFLISGSYFLIGEDEGDVTQQRGFITADAEYVTYGSSKFSPSDENDDQSYYDNVNNVVKQTYKGAFNFRVGLELKFNTFMIRGGVAHYGNPYEDNPIKAGITSLSTGVGYRDKGIFIDLGFVRSITQDSNFPYRLSDKANTFADVKSKIGQVLLTVGFKFY